MGYPNGLSGEKIPLEGRITAVADVFDAILSDRSYRKAMSLDQAVAVIDDGRGTHFDPEVADALLGTSTRASPSARRSGDRRGRRAGPPRGLRSQR